MIIFFSSDFYRTRQRTSIETLSNVHSSSTPNEILRRICEQCAITDIEHFDPVLCDGVNINKIKKNEISFVNVKICFLSSLSLCYLDT